ncbi:predicted protein [Chaetoceros tenuissimus]|uniref:Uncharacterized protein n=1 Tax=Chaetoceros tenuissimus TaxID=426638 RepID=A0AAD3DCZ9_9STRA|nr:predicted protein [Chaetoceros tenuissimus]
MIGNSITCRIQDWFVIFGVCGATASTSCLCWYFVLSIVFKVDRKKITKYIAPVMYIYILSISVAVATFYTKIDMMNPNLTSGTCDIAPYPISCDEELWWDWNECTWKEGVLETYFENQYVILYAIVSQFFLVFTGMPLILCKSCQKRKRKDNEQPAPYVPQTISAVLRGSDDGMMSSSQEQTQEDISQADSEWQRGRVLINQSFMYMGALAFGICLYSCTTKTFLLRQTEPELGFFKAVKKILSSPSDAARIVLSDLSNVRIEPRITKQEEPSKKENSQGISYETSSASKNLSYDSKINLSMYDSISEHRNNMSRTSHVIGNTSHAIANENRSYEYYTDSYE